MAPPLKTAIILCAGEGTRMGELTHNCPKPMLKIAGKPLLEWILLYCRYHGIKTFGINVCYLPDQIIDYFGNGSKWGVRIYYSQEPEALGTSGALLPLRHLISTTTLVIYGDTITDLNLSEFVDFHKKKKAMLTLATREKMPSGPIPSYVEVDSRHYVTEFIEKPTSAPSPYLANSGIYCVEPSIFNAIPPETSDFGFDVIPRLLRTGKRVAAYPIDHAYFREIGTQEKYQAILKEWQSPEFKLNFFS